MKKEKKEIGLLSFLTRQTKNENAARKTINNEIRAANTDYLSQMNSPLTSKEQKSPSRYMPNPQKNPFYEYAQSYAMDRPEVDEAKKRWKQVGRAAALTNVFSAIGKGISVMNGAKVRNIDTSTADKSIRHIDKYDDILRNDMRRYNNELTRIALHGESRSDRATENYIKSLEQEANRINRSSIADKRELSRALSAEERQQRNAEEKALDRAEKRAREAISSTLRQENRAAKAKKATAPPKPKVVTFLKDQNQNSVPIFEDDLTQLYRIADLSGYLDSYRKEKNAQTKRLQLNVGLQKAYIDYSNKHKNKKSKGVDFLPKFFFYPESQKSK